MFNSEDISVIQEKGLSKEQVDEQIRYLTQGFPYLKLDSPAIVGKGITRLSDKQVIHYKELFHARRKTKRMVKFVPASGAATRMFKELFEWEEHLGSNPEWVDKKLEDFVKNLSRFAFYEDIISLLKKEGKSLHDLMQQKKFPDILQIILRGDGLNYGNIPKGLIKFHTYEGYSRTALEEHLVEGTGYAANTNDEVYIHFTVSEEFMDDFQSHVMHVKEKYEQQFWVKYHISFSVQKSSTDTIAVDMDNNPFRDEKGHILFRPGGHGALLDNLDDIEADIIFVKNIDNVAPDALRDPTITFKQALAGILLEKEEKAHYYLRLLDNNAEITDKQMQEISVFLEKELCVTLPENFRSQSNTEKLDFLRSKLNRPIRVCGMVKNEGEPGGGPFWVVNKDGTLSLQIVETSQINTTDHVQAEILKRSTHFNPVDLVCSVRDYKGNAFNLMEFRDPSTGFISHKSSQGRQLKALELPGLWNGAMADWNTLFVEVPIETFSPVKTLFDLLRKEHQVGSRP